ncbi:MAG: type II toxin-antitoxin system RelE/ParE family toxin [Limisphaerales bacterium]
MKGLPVFFTALAEEDLDQIEDYISAHDRAAAARVRAAVGQQSIELGNAPETGMALKDPLS